MSSLSIPRVVGSTLVLPPRSTFGRTMWPPSPHVPTMSQPPPSISSSLDRNRSSVLFSGGFVSSRQSTSHRMALPAVSWCPGSGRLPRRRPTPDARDASRALDAWPPGGLRVGRGGAPVSGAVRRRSLDFDVPGGWCFGTSRGSVQRRLQRRLGATARTRGPVVLRNQNRRTPVMKCKCTITQTLHGIFTSIDPNHPNVEVNIP